MSGASLNTRALLAVLLVAAGVVVHPPTRVDATTVPGQVITVQASSSRSRTAVLRTWRLDAAGHYVQIHGPVLADVGVNGVGPTREGLGRTPVGVFTLTRAFGSDPNDGSRLPYVRTGPDDWWDENPTSARYNELVRSSVSPGGDSENLYDAGLAYAHAVVINYNVNPVVKGAGSGFFLHVSVEVGTEGCVSIPAADLRWVMRWLNPALHPVISIGVGRSALAAVASSS
jgi:L,D-peptidoglycan transpeptidase YkuD (ErfK/YbiS/YcfS/YnhG family)